MEMFWVLSVLGEKIASFRNKHLGNNKTGYLLSQQLTASSEGHKLPYVPKSGVIPSTNPQNSGLSYFSWIERIFLLFSALPRVDEKSCLLSVAETMGTVCTSIRWLKYLLHRSLQIGWTEVCEQLTVIGDNQQKLLQWMHVSNLRSGSWSSETFAYSK